MRCGLILLLLLGFAACGVKGDPVTPGESTEDSVIVVQ